MRRGTKILLLVFLGIFACSGAAFALPTGLDSRIDPANFVNFINPDTLDVGAVMYYDIDYDPVAKEGTYLYQFYNENFSPNPESADWETINKLLLPIGYPTADDFLTLVAYNAADNTVDEKDVDGVHVLEFVFGPLVNTTSPPLPPVYAPRGIELGEWSDVIEIYTSFEPGEALVTIFNTGGSLEEDVLSAVISPYGGAGSVPEPSTLLLLGAGLLAVGLRRRMRGR